MDLQNSNSAKFEGRASICAKTRRYPFDWVLCEYACCTVYHWEFWRLVASARGHGIEDSRDARITKHVMYKRYE